MNALLQDLRYGLRVLLRKPGYTIVAIVCLALGIGVNVAVFSVINSAFLTPLPIRDPGQVVSLYVTELDADEFGSHSYPDFVDLREQCADVIELCARDESVPIHFGAKGGAWDAGGAVGFFLTRFIANHLYGIEPTDPLTFIVVGGILLVAAFLSCLVPALRATRIDPMTALRNE